MVLAGGPSSGEGMEDSTNNAPNSQQEKDEPRRTPYTMHGVLHFIQHEWSRYEMERSKWEMERSEMQARISFLQGERKAQENLKSDLVRRIKMLEYCLKQERAKNYRLTHNGEDPPEMADDEEPHGTENGSAPLEVDAFPMEGGGNSSALGWKQGRQLLKQYLQEIGYSETILDVRSFRVKNLLGLIPQGDWPHNGPAQNAHKGDDSDSEGEHGGAKLDSDAAEALDEFDFLKSADVSAPATSNPSSGGKDNWAYDPSALEQLKEKYKHEKRQKKNSGSSGSDDDRRMSTDSLSSTGSQRKAPAEFRDLNEALGLPPPGDDANIDIKDDFVAQEEEGLGAAQWQLRATLRSHLDSIRAMQFHPVEPVLFTASEDGTAKMWNLDAKTASGESKGEMEPVYTFRGHLGAVLCMDLSPTGDHLYTGGVDGVVCCWNVPSSNIDAHDVYDPKVLSDRLRGHSDAVWSVAFHSSDNRLVSASADSTVKIWEPTNNFGESLLRTIAAPRDGLIPTSVDFVSTEPQQLLISYTQCSAVIVDMETGQTVLTFNFGPDANAGSTITKILSHPTMPVTILAGDDRKIRYFDNNTGELVHSSVAHVEAISSLAVDPNGLYLLSGSHDGSLRLWNMEKRVCMQEISAHRKKYDASVTSVAFHPSRPLIGSAGADALAKVFITQ